MSSRMNQWFVPGEGIAREVITADIQRYLGPDALVRPGTGTGEYEQGRSGYWITAYRTLTSQMIQDLRSDSQRWQAEKDRGRGGGTPHIGDKKVTRHPDASVVAYQDSTIHASRQYHGPTTSDSYAAPSKPSYSTPTYGNSESPHYTTTPTAPYGSHGYQAPPHSAHPAQPRTDPQSAYYGQHASYASTPAPQSYSYSQPPVQDPYGRAPTQQYAHATPSVVAAPGYYIASDGRQYPLSQQPQQPQPPPAGRRRG
ncbi:uncharacterized protein CC84DRAFT_939102 [Paraphaeosphaeria sporulosa]|uniref:Transcription factor RfeG n=1 Tax=Paraphaeosphaeria sporulosa TaxID=1460663 RepID=A0A177C633_9PLEO|nr:uncharacterized protein CC84DRAFT_939102 [Paraphaeosphaeria sporulosa]OAG02985.1 hypothetical protein CC84DRAFT_939102 [Paraphaeosphaeria sporulosa]